LKSSFPVLKNLTNNHNYQRLAEIQETMLRLCEAARGVANSFPECGLPPLARRQ
jgi:hypothetical protein